MRDHGPLCSSLGLREQECGAALIVEDQPATPARSSGELSLDEGRNELKSKVLDRIYCQIRVAFRAAAVVSYRKNTAL